MTRVKDLVCSSLKVKASERGGEGDAGVELLPRCCALFDRVDLADLGATGRALRVALLQDIASVVTGLAVKRLRDALAHSAAPEAAKQRLASLATQTLEAAIRGASGGEPEQARLAGLLVAELAQVQGWGEVELARRAERVVSWNARRLGDARKALADLQRRCVRRRRISGATCGGGSRRTKHRRRPRSARDGTQARPWPHRFPGPVTS
jgi:hypothetical protein